LNRSFFGIQTAARFFVTMKMEIIEMLKCFNRTQL